MAAFAPTVFDWAATVARSTAPAAQTAATYLQEPSVTRVAIGFGVMLAGIGVMVAAIAILALMLSAFYLVYIRGQRIHPVVKRAPDTTIPLTTLRIGSSDAGYDDVGEL